MISENPVCVFLGPSLPIEKARAILPDAQYFPPVYCGNLLHVIRLNPKVIVIIDGYFERIAAVWHKEILYALSRGILVYGGASMGALRAAELAEFGMKGVGKIYESYAKGFLKDDDEVTVLHKSSKQGYAALTNAMVDIRHQVDQGQAEGWLDEKQAKLLIQEAKRLFYQERTLEKAVQQAIEQGGNAEMISRFFEWACANAFSQKEQDAQRVLQQVKQDLNQILGPSKPTFKFSSTSPLRALSRMVSSEPFFTYSSDLPIQEKVVIFSRLLGDDYSLIKRLARLAAIIYTRFKQTTSPKNAMLLGQEDLAYDEDWKIQNDCESRFESFSKRMQCLRGAIQEKVASEKSSFYMACFMVLSGDYSRLKQKASSLPLSPVEKREALIHLFQQENKNQYKAFKYAADLWTLVEAFAQKEALIMEETALAQMLHLFRSQYQLLETESYEAWLNQHDLTEQEFKALVETAYRFDYVVKNHNLDAIGAFDPEENTYWLLDALYCLDFYRQAKGLMTDESARKAAIDHILSKVEQTGEAYFYRLDFSRGQSDFEEFLDQINQTYPRTMDL